MQTKLKGTNRKRFNTFLRPITVTKSETETNSKYFNNQDRKSRKGKVNNRNPKKKDINRNEFNIALQPKHVFVIKIDNGNQKPKNTIYKNHMRKYFPILRCILVATLPIVLQPIVYRVTKVHENWNHCMLICFIFGDQNFLDVICMIWQFWKSWIY